MQERQNVLLKKMEDYQIKRRGLVSKSKSQSVLSRRAKMRMKKMTAHRNLMLKGIQAKRFG